MAGTIAPDVLFSTIKNLHQFVQDERNLLGEVRDDLKALERELSSMQALLEDRETNHEPGLLWKEWVSQSRDLCQKVEDIMDTSTLYFSKETEVRLSCLTCLCFTWQRLRWSYRGHKIEGKIEKVNSLLKEIFDRAKRYEVLKARSNYGGENTSKSIEMRRELAVNLNDRDLVDFDQLEQVKIIKLEEVLEEQLLNKAKNKMARRRMVVSIVGMGGVGKGALARKVYDKISGSFDDYHCWIDLSLGESNDVILKKIMKKFGLDHPDNTKELEDYLSNKRYLIVMDGVWETSIWNFMKGHLPDDRNGSRVLIITRDEKVARSALPRSNPIKMGLLTEEKGLELLKKKIFSESERTEEYYWMGEYLKNIHKECGGLPVALSVVGDLLAGKKKIEIEWKKEVGNNCKKWKQTKSGRLCMELVGLSYKNLSQNLKRCFRYLSLFPKHYKISSKRLILLWVAIEFVIDDKDEKAEEKAECCLDELVEKGLIIGETWGRDGNLKQCSMHPLLHDICVTEAVETDYVEIHCENECIHRNSGLTRRLGIHNCSEIAGKFPESTTKKLRSLTWVNNAEIFTLYIKSFKLLRVLDLQGANMKELPAQMWEMVLITYLGLRNTQLRVLPSFRGANHRLQTLDIRDTKIRVIPDGVWKIKTLRHIRGTDLQAPHIGRTTFNNLQTLHGVEAGDRIQSSGLADGNTLNSLKLVSFICESNDLIKLPESLTKVSLSNIVLEGKFWEMLGMLSNLRILKAKDDMGSVSLVWEEGMFQNLQVLKLCNFDRLETLTYEAIRHPTRFVIDNCKKLEINKKLESEKIRDQAAKKFKKDKMKKVHANMKPPKSSCKYEEPEKCKELKIKVVPWVIINGKISKYGTSPAVFYKMKNFITPKSPFYV